MLNIKIQSECPWFAKLKETTSHANIPLNLHHTLQVQHPICRMLESTAAHRLEFVLKLWQPFVVRLGRCGSFFLSIFPTLYMPDQDIFSGKNWYGHNPSSEL
jgi:hypothetical protein